MINVFAILDSLEMIVIVVYVLNINISKPENAFVMMVSLVLKILVFVQSINMLIMAPVFVMLGSLGM
jgi:hypothetical protein